MLFNQRGAASSDTPTLFPFVIKQRSLVSVTLTLTSVLNFLQGKQKHCLVRSGDVCRATGAFLDERLSQIFVKSKASIYLEGGW